MKWFRSRIAAGTVPALFLHIQKTAGTSLVNMARRYYGDSVVSHADYCDFAPDALRKFGFISGHFGYAYARQLMEHRFSFTFLRDPVERILSFYGFCRTREHIQYDIYQLARDHELPDFLEQCMATPFLKMQVWNNQVWQLAHGYVPPHTANVDEFSPAELLRLAKEHLHEFSHVGFTETFAADTAPVLDALGFPPMNTLPIANVGPPRLAFADQSSEVQDLLNQLTVLDRQLYEYARHDLVKARRGRSWL